MKDLSLPIMSKDEREEMWNNLKEGDTLVYIDYSHWGDDHNIRYYKVIKKTGKGSIRLDNGELLKYFNSNYHILTEELKTWIINIELEKDIMNLLYYVDRDKKYFKSNLEYEDALKLKEILEKSARKV